MTSVINVREGNLKAVGYESFKDWYERGNNLYIGGSFKHSELGEIRSKWGNPFYSVYGKGEEECLELYRTYVRNEKWSDLGELVGKELGCWCDSNSCHGKVLLEIVGEMIEEEGYMREIAELVEVEGYMREIGELVEVEGYMREIGELMEGGDYMEENDYNCICDPYGAQNLLCRHAEVSSVKTSGE